MVSENISLKKEQQTSFDIAVKHLRKKVKDGDIGIQGDTPRNRGVVRLSRIPHGFYEDEIRKYFSQFGVVTRLRVARSRKTGNSKGFAFVEFKVPEVAKVVAETMNNYLMFDHILKARYIPPEEQKVNFFIGVSKDKVPLVKNRRIAIASHNRKLTKKDGQNLCRKLYKNLNKQLKKIKELGIEYDFKPVRVSKRINSKAVLTLDESDEEITFKIPRNVEVIKREAANDAFNRKGMTSRVEEGTSDAGHNKSAIAEGITKIFADVNEKRTLLKRGSHKMNSPGRSSLRGIKKPRSLKVSTRAKLDNQKKIRGALQLGIAKMKAAGDFNCMWRVTES